ncbi:MAG: glycine cleavage T C-terminal barrel domain-containing protein [Longimicrobiales bacterium]|nr:glycine cleavage T C-terminal barrel domain-containing protein [Longimicrobiales bacterium]
MSHPHPSPFLDAMKSQGGVTGDHHGQTLVRHFGDPHGEYIAATEAVAVFDRSHRTRLVVSGRSPRQMLGGILTGTIPAPPAAGGEGVLGGTATYHAVLTPKGKMLTDLWCLCRAEADAGGDFLLDVPVAGRAALLDHLRKALPPRLAKVEDVTHATASLSVVGPTAGRHVSSLALGLRVDDDELSALAEGEWRTAGAFADGGVAVMRTGEVWPEAYTLYGPTASMGVLWKALAHGGARPAGLGVWSTLRVEAGRPAFGTDMDESTIPIEAGIHERAIDYTKGCYTGQEVIVRIRDRGHVNRNLRQLMLGDVPAPHRGAELFVEGSDRPVGHVTSAVESPRFAQTVALGYVRRGVEGVVRVGDGR